MSLRYRNKKTGEVVVVKDVQPSLMALSSLKELLDESIPIPSARLIVKYWELPLQSSLEIHSVFREDFLRTHEPIGEAHSLKVKGVTSDDLDQIDRYIKERIDYEVKQRFCSND